MLTGQQTDSSALAETGWYEWVYYRDSESSFPYPVERLGRCLGPCEHKGTVMSQYILNDQGSVLPYQTFRILTKDKNRSASESLKRDNFDLIIRSKLVESITLPPQPIPLDEPSVRTPESIPDADYFTDFDEYINVVLMLVKEGEGMVAARIVRRYLGPDGNAVGSFNHKKMLYTRIYDIMFMEGTVQQLAVNVIALSMYKHVDSEGFTTKILDQVQRYWKTDEAIETYDGYFKDSKGRSLRKITTKGYYFLAKFRDGSES